MPESVCESITDAGTPSAKLLADDPSYLAKLKAQGLRIIAPSMNDLYKGTEHGPVRSAWAEAATEAGLRIITWTLERSPPGDAAAAWYWRADGKGEGSNVYSDTVIDKLTLLHTLFTVVGIEAIFSDVSAAAPFASSFRSSKQRLHSGRRLYRCMRTSLICPDAQSANRGRLVYTMWYTMLIQKMSAVCHPFLQSS